MPRSVRLMRWARFAVVVAAAAVVAWAMLSR